MRGALWRGSAHRMTSYSCGTDGARKGSRPSAAKYRHTPSAQQSAAAPSNGCPLHASGAVKAGVPKVLRSSLPGLAGDCAGATLGLGVLCRVPWPEWRVLTLLSSVSDADASCCPAGSSGKPAGSRAELLTAAGLLLRKWALPKSTSLTSPHADSSRFAGFKSPWHTSAACISAVT